MHRGSLVAAVASYLFVRSRPGGRWFLRFDDLDEPRNAPGAVDLIQRQLLAYGLEWDGSVTFQSEHQDEYRQGLEELKKKHLVFRCQCSRVDLDRKGVSRNRWGERIHLGPCGASLEGPASLRLWLAHPALGGERRASFQDLCCGLQECDLTREWGSPVLLRADGVISYHLANVMDDLRMKITHVVRGADLIGVTHVHRELFRIFSGSAGPAFGHVRLLTDAGGRKLSKSEGALPLEQDPERCAAELRACLEFLGLGPLPEGSGSVREVLEMGLSICREIHERNETHQDPKWFAWQPEGQSHPTEERG